MPNRLRYCGGDDNRTLLEYALANEVDPGLERILRKFTGALPYLKLIARANGIADPFDERVVEAYWLGNNLLQTVEARQLYDTLAERADRQLSGRVRALVLGKAPAGARPHHNFHVFDVYSRMNEIGDTLLTMDQCRVSWGHVVGCDGPNLVVERQPLVIRAGKLALGEAVRIRALRDVDGRSLVGKALPGDWVSMHWGWICEVLAPRQIANLRHYTDYHLAIANQTV
jgi:hypothetical protein